MLFRLGFKAYEASNAIRRSREMAESVRELADRVPSQSAEASSTGTLEPPKATSVAAEASGEIVVRSGLDLKTLEYQETEIWDHLWLLEGHLKGACRDCATDLGCCMKHSGGLAALAKETMSMTTDPKYQELTDFASEVFWKSQVEDIIKGIYANEYPALAVRASELRKKFKKTLPPPPEKPLTLEEAKAEAAEEAAKRVEESWER